MTGHVVVGFAVVVVPMGSLFTATGVSGEKHASQRGTISLL